MAASKVIAYSPDRYNSTQDISPAAAALPRFEGFIPALGRIIAKHGHADLVGICLLHNHFPLSASERMVEVIQDAVSLTKPLDVCSLPAAEAASALIPRMFGSAVQADGSAVWYPLEFLASSSDGAAELSAALAVITADTAFLSEVAHFLHDHQASHMFGLSPGYRLTQMQLTGENFLQLEQQHPAERMLRVEVVDKTQLDLHGADLVPTFWTCDAKQAGTCINVAYCGQTPVGHINLHVHKRV